MPSNSAPTFWARIYMAGPVDQAEHLMREECMREGLCVTVTPTKYVYTGGEEAGFVVELINYPRFPSTPESLTSRARHVAQLLRSRLYQHSYTIMFPDTTEWDSLRT